MLEKLLDNSGNLLNSGRNGCNASFKDESTANIKLFNRDFEYELRNPYKEIVFNDSGPMDLTNEDSITMSHRYTIKKISDDEIVLEGQSLSEGKNCLLERK